MDTKEKFERERDAAAIQGLEALDDRVEEGPFPAEDPVEWPQATPPGWDKNGSVATITDEDLSAACGLALDAELQEKPVPWLMPEDIAAEWDRA